MTNEELETAIREAVQSTADQAATLFEDYATNIERGLIGPDSLVKNFRIHAKHFRALNSSVVLADEPVTPA